MTSEAEFAELLATKTSGEPPPVDTEEDKEEDSLEEVPATEQVSEVTEEDTEEAVEEPTEGERLYAGRYKTVEELEKATEEKEALLARQGTEIGELRSMIEQGQMRTQADIAQLRSDSFDPDEEWQEWADSEIQRGKESGEGDMTAIEAIAAAGAEGGPEAARYVLARWHQIDPAAATAFQMQAFSLESRLRERAELQKMAEDEPSENGGPPQSMVDEAWDAVSERHPDMPDYRDEMRETLASLPAADRERWEIKVAADPASGEDFLEYLYLRTRASSVETRLQERDEATAQARRRKADEEAAGDTVASATASPTRAAPVPKVRGFDHEAFRREAGLAPLE